MELGELSEGLKLAAINVGSVFVMTFFPEDGITPKNDGDISRDKIFVVIGKSDEGLLVASLLINSEVNQHLSEIIGDYQHEIKASEYDFLEHDSFINGYEVREISVERILEQARFLGILNEEDINMAIWKATSSPVIKEYIIKTYHLEL